MECCVTWPVHPLFTKQFNMCSFIVVIVILHLFSDLFSSGMCSAIMVSGSVHSTIQPCLSLTLPTSGFKKWLGTRLHITGVSISTSRRGGHWGMGFVLSLRNMAAERGMMFWRREVESEEEYSDYTSDTFMAGKLRPHYIRRWPHLWL